MTDETNDYPIGARVALVFDEDGDVDFADGCTATVVGSPDAAGWMPVVVDCEPGDRYWFSPDELRPAVPGDLPCVPPVVPSDG